MELNWIVFPAPKPNYFGETDFRQDGSLIFVPYAKPSPPATEEEFKESKDSKIHPEPKFEETKHKEKTFPCFFIPYEGGDG